MSASTRAIRAERLGKCYRLRAAARPPYRTLRDALIRGLRGGWWSRRPPTNDRDYWALQDVSFEIDHGEVIGIIGRNGAGKSTLLKILARITPPTAGRAEIYGRIGSLLEVGTGFHPELTGRENIFLNGQILGMRRDEIARRFDEIVDFAEIERFLDTPVKHYSSGMYMRLAFAVAAHLDPEILIVDEVLAVGDAAFQEKCLGKMDQVRGSGRTILFVSHNMGAIERLCARTLVLEAGRVAYLGPTRGAVAHYLAGTRAASASWARTTPAPAGPHFLRLELCDEQGAPCPAPTSANRVGVAIDFKLPAARSGLSLGLALLGPTKSPVFATSPTDDGIAMPTAAGTYRLRVLFPEGILMPKQYSIGATLYDSSEIHDAQSDAFTFRVIEVASLVNSVQGGRVGDVQIHCRWMAPVECGR